MFGEAPGAHPSGDRDERQHGVGPSVAHDPLRESQDAARPGKPESGSSSLSGPAPDSSRLREPGGSGDAQCASAPSRGPRPLNVSARSSVALWQLIAITGPSRVYLSPAKSWALASTSGGVAVPLLSGLAELGRFHLRLQHDLEVADERSGDEDQPALVSRVEQVPVGDRLGKAEVEEEPRELLPRLTSPRCSAALARIPRSSGPWAAPAGPRRSTARGGRPARPIPAVWGRRSHAPPSEPIGGCFSWK